MFCVVSLIRLSDFYKQRFLALAPEFDKSIYTLTVHHWSSSCAAEVPTLELELKKIPQIVVVRVSHFNKIISDFIRNKKPPHIRKEFFDKVLEKWVVWLYHISNCTTGQVTWGLWHTGFRLTLMVGPLPGCRLRLTSADQHLSQLYYFRQCLLHCNLCLLPP